jgi:hypothetical protein
MRFTRPMRWASAASSRRAVKKMSLALPGPTRWVRLRIADMRYPRPRRVAGTKKVESVEATRRSQLMATFTPPPTQYPRMHAIVGLENS